jgi:hypothetical protein
VGAISPPTYRILSTTSVAPVRYVIAPVGEPVGLCEGPTVAGGELAGGDVRGVPVPLHAATTRAIRRAARPYADERGMRVTPE